MLTEALTHVADQLKAAGLRAAIDPRDLVIPAVWVTVDSYDTRRLRPGAAIVGVKLIIIAPDQGHAIRDLDALAATVCNLYPLKLTAAVVSLPNQAPDPLPALVGTLDIDVQED